MSVSSTWGPTFMDQFRTGPEAQYEFNRHSWRQALAQNRWTGDQIKTAIMREARDRPGTRPAAAPLLRSEFMRQYRGHGTKHDSKPGQQYGFMDVMGPHGNIGLRSYNLAKQRGYKPSEIKTLATKYGMVLPEGAQAEYEKDIAETTPEVDPAASLMQFQTDVANVMKSFTQDRSAPPESTVLRGQTGRLYAKKPRSSSAGTNQFKRGYVPERMPHNLGIKSASAGKGPLNIA